MNSTKIITRDFNPRSAEYKEFLSDIVSTTQLASRSANTQLCIKRLDKLRRTIETSHSVSDALKLLENDGYQLVTESQDSLGVIRRLEYRSNLYDVPLTSTSTKTLYLNVVIQHMQKYGTLKVSDTYLSIEVVDTDTKTI